MGASLLIFLNKTDVEGCMSQVEVREVRLFFFFFDYDNLSLGLLIANVFLAPLLGCH